ncbi:TPA: GNAT family N-acetyltransferase [Providencia rettgeri]|uniref:GNAT family N-acetyltransferase n=1 Tax=Providencia TaxID=586 RepID=UPI001B927DF4|nr:MULTISPECIES: GNAT family N-acetyltransferase [unclassified Providencia]HBC7429695.1 GNAT family N-acetyltransferase [Providencia rettgeri]
MQFVIVQQQDTQLIDQISSALHQEWATLTPWSDISIIKERLFNRSHIDNPQILSCFVDEHGQLLACASIILHELPDVSGAQWWLGEVLTIPSARGRKIGTKLIEQLYQYYHRFNIAPLYLYTPDMQALYRQMGWEDAEQRLVNGEWVTVMKR